MKVYIHVSLLNDPTAFETLDEIARLLRTGCHKWVIHEAEIDSIEMSVWLTSDSDSRGGRRNRELFEKTAKLAIEQRDTEPQESDSLDPSPRIHRILLVVGGPAGIAPADGLAQLQQPVFLLVEDDDSDGRFVRCIARVFERDELQQALDNHWLTVLHCGGEGGVRKRAERLLHSNSAVQRRIHALLDSDRLFPGHDDTKPLETARLLRGLGVNVTVLRKRETENYLPFAALAVARQQLAYRTFRDRLSPVQQDHFDMKSGFKKHRTTDSRGRVRSEPIVPDAQSILYADLPVGVRTNLIGGFGKGCGKLFDHPEVTREGLESRCQSEDPSAATELLDFLLGLEETL